MSPRALAAVLALVACAGVALLPSAASASVKRIRVFTVQPRLDVSWLESRAAYEAKLRALTDASQRSAAPVQQGAGDVASRTLLGERNLVTFPEDLGLFTIFAGSRGTVARQAPDVVTAVASLLGPYADLVAYYQAKYPALVRRPLPTRALALAATDTFGRIGLETYAALARRLGAYVVGGQPMARSWQVVCTSKASFVPPPGVERCDEEDPVKVARLRGPDEPGRTYAYEATSPDVVNLGVVFSPKGELLSKQEKTYLTPIELEDQLDLVPGAPTGGLTVVPTPVGRIGVVTSKDAWMPDVTAKLDEDRADVLVQPEFFEGSLVSRTGFWQPDNLKASGYADVLRHPSIEALALPELTGRVFGVQADAQSHVVRKPRGVRAKRRGLVGQPEDFGWVAVAPFVVPDALRPSEPIADRRRRIGAAGEALLATGPPCPAPDVRAPCRDGHVERVLAADVDVQRRPAYRRTRPAARGRAGAFSPARPVAPTGREQRNVSVAARGNRVWAAFEERTADQRDRVVVAFSRDGGRSWGRPVRVSDRVGRGNARVPSISVGRDGKAWLAWQQDRSGVPRVFATRGTNGRFGRIVAVAPSSAAPQRRPSIAATSRRAYVAWIDERERLATGTPKAAVWGAKLGVDLRVAGARSLDAGEPVKLAAGLDHDWAPDVAADGPDVTVAWLSFKTYDWRVYARRSINNGTSFVGGVQPVGHGPVDRESLDDEPDVAVDGRAARIAFTDFTAEPATGEDLAPNRSYDIALAAPGGRATQVDDRAGRPVATFSPAQADLGAGRSVVAWQDHADGVARIRAAPVSRLGRRRGPTLRVDGGPPGSNAWRPAATLSGERALVAWEDERDGPSQVYVASAPVGRLVSG